MIQPTHTLGNLLGFLLLLQSGLILCVNVCVGGSACMAIFRFFSSECLFIWLFCSLMVYVHVCIKCVCILAFWCLRTICVCVVFSCQCEPLRLSACGLWIAQRRLSVSMHLSVFRFWQAVNKAKEARVGEETKKRLDENRSRKRGGKEVVRGGFNLLLQADSAHVCGCASSSDFKSNKQSYTQC